MKFLKIFLAALLACVVSGILGFIFWLGAILSLSGLFDSSNVVSLKPNSILKIELGEIFTDSPSSDPLSQIDYTTMEILPSISLLQALRAIDAAAEDPNIEAIYLRISPMATLPAASLEELRKTLELFQQSGKKIIAYNDRYTQSAYYLSSVADKIYAHGEGMIIWQGMASNTMFYKGLLDKLDVTVDVFRPTACKYKSAVEPFIMEKMSAENKKQMEQLLSSMWSVIASDVALSRGLTVEQVNSIANNLECMDVDDALKARMIDGVIYEDQLSELFREAGASIAKEDKDVNYIDFVDYISLKGVDMRSLGAPKVGIIYAEGNIVDGQGVDAQVYGDTTAELIRKTRLDESIKAVVLRVNSPGGSALASDVMWRELELLRQVKPLVVSMGAYAASGGYYISAPADAILADRLTLTGSIGVFGMVPNVEKGLKNKLGITFDSAKTNRSADFLTNLNGMDSFEKQVMLKSVDKVYERFTGLVSQGRNLPLEKVLEIAQGRVWSGVEAVELGLVDANGGLREAISVAATKANIDDNFRIVEQLSEPTGLAALFSSVQMRVAASLKAVLYKGSQSAIESQYNQIMGVLESLNTQHGLLMYSPYSVSL